MGPDCIPEWLLRLGAPFLVYPIAYLFKRSLQESQVPSQWKEALITPIPKIPKPHEPADYRPISVTSLLCRIFEKMMIKSFVYPALTNSSVLIDLKDQFAFRPTGSTTAAIIFILNRIT